MDLTSIVLLTLWMLSIPLVLLQIVKTLMDIKRDREGK